MEIYTQVPEAVALRPQPGLTGTGSYGSSYGGFEEDTRTSARMLAVGNPISRSCCVCS